MIENRNIKFYLSDKVNDSKKNKIIEFLKECNTVENYLLQYYWEHFDTIIKSNSKIDMNYNNKINFKDTVPILKSHHFYTVLKQTYGQLKSIQSNIINRIYFKYENKSKQRVYNYCKGFIFEWDKLSKAVNKELNKNKKDKTKIDFLNSVKELINNEEQFNILKQDIEAEFWLIKSKYKLPQKKEYQIWVDTWLTTVIEKKEFEWFFIIDNNVKFSSKKFDNIIVPVKLSDYHKEVLKDKKIKNTMNLKLNKYGKIEISIVYEENVEYLQNEMTDTIGIDIGLSKLITSSDGEIIEQNKNIIKKAEKIVSLQANRSSLEEHLKIKYNNENYKLGDKRYLKKQNKLSTFVKADNRYKIKNFLKARPNTHIVMEDLKIGYSKTHSRKANYLLRRMKIQYIKNDLTKYGKEFGNKVSLVNPAFTSRQCPECGYISRDNRKTQETFCCVICGYTANADYNAANNILNRYYDDRIKLKTPFWKVKEILQVA